MEKIEISYGLYYDPKLPWFKQDRELITLALEIVENELPVSAEVEETLNGGVRLKEGTWKFNETKSFAVLRYFKYPATHPAWATKAKNDVIIVHD